MAITVVCTACRARLQVSEKYAGKSGACPKCKAVVKIPMPQEEVKIHAPESFASGGKNAAGQLVTKPIDRQDAKFSPTLAIGIAAGVIVVLAVTWIGRGEHGFVGGESGLAMLARCLGLALLTPLLVVLPYRALQDDERPGYAGSQLWLRTAACSGAYMLLWAVLWFLMSREITAEGVNWFFIAPPILIIGSLAALACFDFDPTNAAMHYGFYLIAVLLLRWLAGMPWIWEAAKK